MGNVLTTKGTKLSNVNKLHFVLGGDHEKEAFHLCFWAIIILTLGKLLYKDYGGAGLVKGKDNQEVLDKYLIPWMKEDLQTLFSSTVRISTLEDGMIGCTLSSDEEESLEGTFEMVMLLGMDEMSEEWFIYCMLF